MSTVRQEDELEDDALQPTALASGIVSRGMFDASGALLPPPWGVVRAFVLTGQHRDWVEAYAESSPAFADVLEALGHDHEERSDARRRGGPRR